MNKDDKKRTHIIVTGKGGGGGSDAGAVRFDEAQTLTSAEQLQARENIGVPTEWFGTQAEYDMIDPKDPNTVYHIEGGQPVQSDWNENDSTSLAYIQNKPTIHVMTIQELTFTLEGGVKKTIGFYTAPDYFYVEDISGSDNMLSIVKREDSAPTIEVFCSTDRSNWTSMGQTSTTPITATIPANGKLYLKCTANSWSAAPASPTENIMSASGTHNVGGSVMSLLRGDNFFGATLANNERLSDLFLWDGFLISAENLILPPNTVDDCFRGMFFGCSNLTTPPVLPAKRMYWQCYRCMFFNCTSLTTAPALPATTLADSCYLEMFNGCTSLTTAPALPATTLAANCYQVMFQGCTSLNSVTTYATDITATDCLTDWLNGVAAQGDFYNLGGATYTSGASGIPSGWTEHTSL